jgi:uncharacterized membrane protein YidH (DUF202 family)
MIREIDSTATGSQYVNIIELLYMFIIVELHIALSTVGLYNQEQKKWNIRRLFWYSVIGMPSILILGIFVATAVKFLLQ